MKDRLKAMKNNPTVTSNAKWAKNTAIGTAKGVAIAAVANIAAEGVRHSLRKGLKTKKAR